MKNIHIGEIEEATNGRLICGDAAHMIERVNTDSRTVNAGEIFFPLIGETLDAHAFVTDAIAKGCNAFVMSDEKIASEAINSGAELDIIMVEDTTTALQELAKWYISTFNLKKIGVTGSTGKTSTKDMLYFICSQRYHTARNMGNLNNHLGMPMTILDMEEDTQVAILEMGMNQFGEIHRLVDIARPDIGIITNIGISHMENLGSREGILKAKMEITDYFGENNILIINEGNDLLTKENTRGSYKLVTVGENGKSDFIISEIDDMGEKGVQFNLEHNLEMQKFVLNIPGRHNVYNASLAIAAGLQLGISLADAAKGLEKMVLTEKRLSIRGKDGIKVIDDTYNASPDSMKAAIDVLMGTKGMRHVAILGDMYELGDDTLRFHREVGEYAALNGVDVVVAVGEYAKAIAQGAKTDECSREVLYFESKEQFMHAMSEVICRGDVVLVKASRGMKMEEIVKKILE